MKLNVAVKEKSFEDLVKMKKSHSKVMKIKHERLEMQNYLKSNDIRIKLEEAQEIFKMRSRMSEVKTNFKGKYENFQCNLCSTKEDETEQHVIECTEINKRKTQNNKPPDYKDLYSRNVKKQLTIAQYFIENMKMKNKLEK